MKKSIIRDKYYKFVTKKKKAPATLNKFLSFAGLKKKDFHAKYKCLNEVEADIWKHSFRDIISSLESSNEFAHYTCRERGLAFMYGWFEFIDMNKQFFKKGKMLNSNYCEQSKNFKRCRKDLCKFIKKIMKKGAGNSEFKDRGIPPKFMAEFFWGIFYMNLKKWKKLSSKKNTKRDDWMDAMIEKSMVFFFDSLAPNLFDTFLDMLKHGRSKK
ncbi:MAG: hypothetical protein NE334_11150 [Lentisphaeraceae bacterium]|nr:hypothetical protein [Lentisphaeraceae bacterium]